MLVQQQILAGCGKNNVYLQKEKKEDELVQEKALGNPTDFGIQTKMKFILVPNS